MSHARRGTTAPPGTSSRWWAFAPLQAAIASALVFGLGFGLAHTGLIGERAEIWFYWVAIPLGAWHWTREGLEELFREREVGIEILMLAATAGSGALGLWNEAAALVVLYAAAEGVEEYTYVRTRSAIRSLLDLTPKEARVLADGRETNVPAGELRPGTVFRVRPGESVVTDGVVIQGRSSVDESPVTGESLPAEKEPGSAVYAASINGQGVLDVRATAAFADNSLSRIIHLVEQAQEQKGRAQQWIERFGRRYTPAVLLGSALLIGVPWVMGLDLAHWYYRAVVLLVAAAPCALIMSMPIAMAAAIGSAGRRGILIKGGVHLEHLGAVRVVAFDKTGTLTMGRPTVTDLVVAEGGQQGLLRIAATLEQHSEHPLARAIVERARQAGVAPADPEGFQALVGAGAQAKVEGTLWYVGSPALFDRLGAPLGRMIDQIAALQDQGKTVVAVGNSQRILGLIAMLDSPRPSARATAARLRAMGLRTAMLTGDNRRTAEAIAGELGIEDVRSELKPADKVEAVRQLEAAFGPVLMVGDGVNDAPALAAATCGMAMGVAGTDAAIEAADIALMAEDLGKVEEAIGYGRTTRRVSRQNIAFSVAVLLVLVPSALSGVLGVTLAVAVHEASELLAVLNGLRAGRER